MVKQKAQSKKQQKRGGIDFKKIKRKVGRKLPPPKNATNTEIKSKAIILPEQSVVSDKAGLAVSKKGLTLKELLQQTSHHNAKVRKDALIGIRDIFLKYPAELKLHKLATIEKLRERISDDDKIVRETLYQLFKSVILPNCKQDNQGPFISLMMAYIFNSMTHLAIDVRLMAFRFFDLVIQHHPSAFSPYAEKKILHEWRGEASCPKYDLAPHQVLDLVRPRRHRLCRSPPVSCIEHCLHGSPIHPHNKDPIPAIKLPSDCNRFSRIIRIFCRGANFIYRIRAS
ncbi:unnamed protein product [Coffea canephora]|uniref:Pre-rRNA-processing protein Ipi1 N-terminal domain-containing protein n=1 Tax=Coffea canephora TaxID=49390 RepID=A0A068UQM5_COFCA|nr:unnamed protein product [Coffea canephora]